MTARRATALLVLLIGTLAPAAAARAQDVPVVFVHGFASGAQTWAATSQRLAGVLRIAPALASLPSLQRIETQAATLAQQAGSLPANTIAVAHSQGGLVSREWSRSRPLHGILTLGTPHGGAQLAARGIDLIILSQLLYSYSATASLASGDAAVFAAALSAHLAYVQLLSYSVANALYYNVALDGLVPVASQLVPGSAFLSGLNSPGNVAREGAAISKRVGLVYVADEYWRAGAAVGLAPGSREWAWWVMQVMPPVFDYVAAYIDLNYPTNLSLVSLAAQLRGVAGLTRHLDPMWCWGVTGDALCRVPHDGIVSVTDQAYPGGTNYVVSGPAHTQETDKSDGAIRAVLSGVMGVPSRGAPPPPPPPGGIPPGSLTPGQRLYPDQEMRAAGNGAVLRYQSDGNLVLYGPGGAVLWASDTGGAAGRAEMQTDGNFVIYDASDTPVWATDTYAPGGYLTVRDEGFLMLSTAQHVGIWWTGSGTP